MNLVQEVVMQNIKKILGFVASASSTSREGVEYGKKNIPAAVILQQIGCDELTFVRALYQIKNEFKSTYKCLNIPKCWDGHSSLYFPDAYDTEERICCKVNSNDLIVNEFFELPDAKIRKWKIGDIVYVPMNHPKTIECLINKKLLIIEK